MYKVGTKTYDEHSIVNLAIMKAFVEREVRTDVTKFVNYVFDTATNRNDPPIDVTDISFNGNVARCPYCDAELRGEAFSVSELYLSPELNPDPECDPEERYLCPVCGSGYATFMKASYCCESMEVYQCSECQHVISGDEYDDMMQDGDMPNEWYVVTPWLLEKLKAKGATTMDEHKLWGRLELVTCTPLEKDETLIGICSDLQILEGQEHSWSKYVHVS